MTDADDDLTPAQRRLIRAAVRKAHAKGERAGYARGKAEAMTLVDLVARLTGNPAAAVLKALPDAMLKGWDESKHPRDHGKFASGPGGNNGGVKEGGEWDGAIAADEVDSANTGYSDKRLHPWTDEDGEGHEIWVEEGRYTPPGGEEVTVYRFVSFPTEGDDRDHEGEWVADRSEAREMGRQYAEENHVEIGDPEDSDIPDDVDGVSWGNRDEIGRWTDGSGNELTVRLDEATFRHGGQEYTCYRWTTWRDEDGEWTLDRDQAVADGEEYARSNHVEDEPDEDEDDEEPEYEDTGGDRFDLDALPPPRKRDVALAGEKQSRSAAAFRVGTGVDEAEADHLITKVFGTGSPEEGRRALVASLGMPDDAVVRVTRTGDYEPLFSDDKPMRGAVGVRVSVDHPKMGRVSRFVGVDHQGRRFIRNEIIEIKPQHQGEGLGAEIFARQAEVAAAEGIEYICTHAAGSATEAMNGYYTWPRFGYDQRLDSPASKGPAFKAARERFPEAESILDVMATKEGRDWWKANGTDLHDARFDLDPGGRSMAILAAYQQERAEKKGRVVTKSTSPRSKTPPSKPSGQGSKLGHPPTRPAPAGDDADPHHAAALALLDHAIEQAEAGEPAGDGLDAVLDLLDDPEALARLLSGDPDADPGTVAKAVGWLTVRKAWDESKHPRDKSGHFMSKDALQEAKADPKKAAELRAKVKPEDAGKLEKVLDGSEDPGRTKRGQARHEASQRKLTAAEKKKKTADLLKHMQRVGDLKEKLDPEKLYDLAEHLRGGHMTVAEMRAARAALAGTANRAGFGGGRVRDDMAAALAGHARDAALKARAKQMGLDADEMRVAAGGGAAEAEAEPEPEPARTATTKLTPKQRRALSDYTDVAKELFKKVNGHLRGEPVSPKDAKKVAEIHEALQSAFRTEATELPEGVLVYRGESHTPEGAARVLADARQSLETGEPITRAGYTSTSKDLHTAETFFDDYEAAGKPVPFIYHIKPKRGLDMEPYSVAKEQTGGEEEFLLDHNSRFRVTGVTPPGEPNAFGQRKPGRIEMEQVDGGDPVRKPTQPDPPPTPLLAPTTPESVPPAAPATPATRAFLHTTPDQRTRHAAFQASGAINLADSLVRSIAKRTGQSEDVIRDELAPAAPPATPAPAAAAAPEPTPTPPPAKPKATPKPSEKPSGVSPPATPTSPAGGPKGLAGVVGEWASAPTPRAKEYIETALWNAGVENPGAKGAAKKKVDPQHLARRLGSVWEDLHTAGGTPEELAAVERALSHAGVAVRHKAGEAVTMDGAYHRGGAGMFPGDKATVRRPGLVQALPDGREIVLSKAEVEPAGKTPPATPKPPAPAAPPPATKVANSGNGGGTGVDTTQQKLDTTPVAQPPAPGGGGTGGGTMDDRHQANAARLARVVAGLTDADYTELAAAIAPGSGTENDPATYAAALASARKRAAERAFPTPELPPITGGSEKQNQFAESVRAKQVARMRENLAKIHVPLSDPAAPPKVRERYEAAMKAAHARLVAVAGVADPRFWLDTQHNDFGSLSDTGWDVVSQKMPRTTATPTATPVAQPPAPGGGGTGGGAMGTEDKMAALGRHAGRGVWGVQTVLDAATKAPAENRDASIATMLRYVYRNGGPDEQAGLRDVMAEVGVTPPPSREELHAVVRRLKPLGLDGTADFNRGTVYVRVRDPKSGNTVLEPITDTSDDGIRAAAARAAAEMKKRQRDTAARIRAEKEANRS